MDWASIEWQTVLVQLFIFVSVIVALGLWAKGRWGNHNGAD